MKARFLLQGWLVWGLAVLLVLTLPGAVWRGARPEPFPLHALLPCLLAVSLLAATTLILACCLGPRPCRSPWLALWEAPPELLWGGLVLALWPGSWGPPGLSGWVAAFLLAASPGELRWISQILPPEEPFPRAWGQRVLRRARTLTVLRIAPRWLAVRLPLWLTATLILERILGVRALGTDWMTRLSQRDRPGLAAWILVFALVWSLAQRSERSAS
jgi:hypothetical protein